MNRDRYRLRVDGSFPMQTRREFLGRASGVGAAAVVPFPFDDSPGVEVNDVQSQLNATTVRRVVQPTSIESLQAAIRDAEREGKAICVAGGRHAMGGQQFGRDAVLVDMKRFNRVLKFDNAKGHVEVEAGIEWPELIQSLLRLQQGKEKQWGIREKQTGVDQVSLGGSLASNVHGRGLKFPPIIHDVESFVLVDARGQVHECSRKENTELFSLAIGGYGLFGVIAHVTLRLAPRMKVERVVEVIPVRDLLAGVERRINEGCIFGDCQYATDLNGEATVHPGVFACYRPVGDDVPVPDSVKQLSGKDWADLYKLARTDKKKAFEVYSKYYLTTHGQRYWSDTHQLAGNFEGYRTAVAKNHGTEMITEAYVSKENFVTFMGAVRKDFVGDGADMTYGTIRFIEKDSESFLAWARDPSVCIICNLHVLHTEAGKAQAARHFRRIIDRAIEFGGRYYLTYHRWAERRQVETCYPQFVDFLRLKRKFDPQERFQSDWYRHYRTMFADKLS
jgi:FAD/FMN-containing dehydrogenase